MNLLKYQSSFDDQYQSAPAPLHFVSLFHDINERILHYFFCDECICVALLLLFAVVTSSLNCWKLFDFSAKVMSEGVCELFYVVHGILHCSATRDRIAVKEEVLEIALQMLLIFDIVKSDFYFWKLFVFLLGTTLVSLLGG